MRLKAIPETVFTLNLHQTLDYRKIELATEKMSADQLRYLLLSATKSTMIQQNMIRFLTEQK